MHVNRGALLLASLLLATIATLAVAMLSGSAQLGVADVLAAVRGEAPAVVHAVIIELRLPRALTAFGVGGLLAVAGVLMQVLLRNPLAEPFILGSSGGAAVAALLAMLLGAGTWVIDSAAFAGAMAANLLVFSIAHGTGNWSPARLLLTGVVLAAGFSAATTLLLALSPDQQLRGMLFWLMGDFSFADAPGKLLALLLVIAAGSTLAARQLNILARGELEATVLGLQVPGFRLAIFAVTALATSVSVTAAGVIGFVGLVVPHAIRLIAGSDHRILVPASALAGGSLLVLADTLARTALAPRQLPVGALTAALGVPVFLYLMKRSARRD